MVEKVFAPDDRQTPAIAINDGVDCVPMKLWKSFLIQLLNIAGTGPIFGALMGAVFGPIVFLWIVFVTSPAGLLDKLTPGWMNGTFWAVVILVYYLLATMLPIDKLIGRLYPVFGILLIVMAASVIGGILLSGGKYTIPEISL